MMTNLRFADDLLLVGRSLHQVKVMLGDLMAETRKTGLEVHQGKTNILWNGVGRNTEDKYMKIQGQDFELLAPSASTEYLGRCLAMNGIHDIELNSRISKAWRKIAVYRKELIDKAYPLG